MSLIQQFSYRHTDGKDYYVTAEINYHPALSFDKHSASCRDDLYDDVEVVEVIVHDKDYNDVTDDVYVPDEVLVREYLLQSECTDSFMDFSALTVHDLVDDAEWEYSGGVDTIDVWDGLNSENYFFKDVVDSYHINSDEEDM